jgi:hypothetical protein
MSIESTFPALKSSRELREALEPFGLTPSQRVDELLALGEATWRAFESLAALLLHRAGDTPLLESIPSLSRELDAPLPLEALRPRTRTRIVESGINTWRELASRSPATISSSLSLYQIQLIPVIALAAQRGAALAARDIADPPPPRPDDGEAPKSVAALAPLRLLAQWGQALAGAGTIGEMLDALDERVVPSDIAAAFAALRSESLSTLTGRERTGPQTFATAFASFIQAGAGEREIAVLRRRLGFEPETLEAIGQELGLTRERVRQLQARSERGLHDLANNGEAPEVRWRALELRRQLGVSIRLQSDAAQDAINVHVGALPEADREFAERVLLWLAGPYRLDRATGWIHAGRATAAGPPPQSALLADCADDSRRLDIGSLRERLSELGLVSAAQEDWLATESTLRRIGDSYFLWQGTVADKAEMVLEALGEPATTDEINEIIGEGHNTRGLRGRLLGDERFMRTDKSRIGLRCWGLEEYTGIVDEIAEEIERRGGEADLRAVVSTVAERFQLPVTSVDVYTGAPRFVTSAGRIRLRRPDEPYVPRRAVVDEPGCYVLDSSRCAIRFLVDRDTLRGSGRPLPQGLGGWLGILPGTRVLFDAQGDEVLVSWPDSALMGPSLGSVRRPILAAGGLESDHALLTFNRERATLEVTVVSHDSLETAEGWERVQLLTGLTATSESEFEKQLAAAVGAKTTADLRARLRGRGEADLAERLTQRDDPALDEALNLLKAVL